MADNSVERRLHRSGRNLKRLQKIGADTDRDDDGDENNFAVFPPMRFPIYRRLRSQQGIQLFARFADRPLVTLSDGGV